MFKISEEDNIKLSKLCSWKKDDLMLLWFLEGNPSCLAWVDNIENPEVAVIIAADFCYLLGKIKHPDEIKKILEENAKYRVINGCEEHWVTYLKEYFPNNLSISKRYYLTYDENKMDKDRLNQFVDHIINEYEIKRIDKDIYNEVLNIDWAADGCCFYRSYSEFKEKGIGYVVYKDEQLISIASSYNTYKNIIGVTIGTIEEYKRKGIASACGAALILECLERGIIPEWEAANMNSVRLAEKLGYIFRMEYEIYTICE